MAGNARPEQAYSNPCNNKEEEERMKKKNSAPWKYLGK
jgi:hypothetical protein